jgi:hypothetical protein
MLLADPTTTPTTADAWHSAATWGERGGYLLLALHLERQRQGTEVQLLRQNFGACMVWTLLNRR